MIFPIETRAGIFYTGLLDSVAAAREALTQRSAEQLTRAGQLLADACARAYRTQNTLAYHHELKLYFQARPLVPRYWNHVNALAPETTHGGASAYTRLIQQFIKPQGAHA